MSKYGVGVGDDFPVDDAGADTRREFERRRHHGGGHCGHHHHSHFFRWVVGIAILAIAVAVGVQIGERMAGAPPAAPAAAK